MSSASEYASGSFVGRTRKHTFLILVLVFIVGTVLSLSGRQGSVVAQVDGEKLGVLGSYGETLFISMSEITQVSLVDELEFGTAVDAEGSGNTMCGTYENTAYGVYELRAYTKNGPYIVVTYGDGDVLVFNQASKRQTQAIFDDLEG